MSDLSSQSISHPFRELCLSLIDRDGQRTLRANVWFFRKDGWEIVYSPGRLVVRANVDYAHKVGYTHKGPSITVWSDSDGGQLVNDLWPYEDTLNRWMILESLGNIPGTGRLTVD